MEESRTGFMEEIPEEPKKKENPANESQYRGRGGRRGPQQLIEWVNELFLIQVLAGLFLTELVGLLLTAVWRTLFGVTLEFPSYQIIGFFILLIWAGRRKIILRRWLHIKKPKFLPMVLSLVAGPACYIISIEIATIIMMIFRVRGGEGTSAFTISAASALLNAGAAGVFEEILFRGILFPAYRQKSLAWGILFSSLLFGVLHFHVVQGSYAIFVGIFLCLLYVVTDNLVYPVATHFFIDMQPILWLKGREWFSGLFPGYGNTAKSLTYEAEIWLLPAVLSALFLILVLAILKKWKEEQDILEESVLMGRPVVRESRIIEPVIRKPGTEQIDTEQVDTEPVVTEPGIAEKRGELPDRGLKIGDTNLIAGLCICALMILVDLLMLINLRF